MPKKKSRKALFSALSSKVKEGKLVVLEEWTLAEIKTRWMQRLLNRFQLKGIVLIAVSQVEEALFSC